jgi:PhnB protein
MAGIVLNPYLNFDGNCEEAMKFYENVFGGELTVSRFKEFPHSSIPAEYEDKVMHAALTANGIAIMASDGMPGRKVTFGDSVNCSLSGEDEAVLTKYFAGLSDGGTVTMPLEKQVWGDQFGMVTDKFGIHWLVNINANKEGAAQ